MSEEIDHFENNKTGDDIHIHHYGGFEDGREGSCFMFSWQFKTWKQAHDFKLNLLSNQEVIGRLKEQAKPENVFDTVILKLIPFLKKDHSDIDLVNWFSDYLESILEEKP